MDDTPEGSVVQLEGDVLERARSVWNEAQNLMREARGKLAELGTIVVGTVEDARQAAYAGAFEDIRSAAAVEMAARDSGGSTHICYYAEDGTCLACWVDPPGVCRPCHENKPGPASPVPVYLMLEEY